MKRPKYIGQDFSGQELGGLNGYYKNCNLSNCILSGKIDAVLKDCIVTKITFNNVNIIRLHTPGTKLPNVIINKHSFQPLHWLKCNLWKQHSHEYNAGLMRKYANKLGGVSKSKIIKGADYIEAHKEMSWRDFLYSSQVPKDVWLMFEKYYEGDEEYIKYVREVIKIRYPNEI